ncbi:MAG: LysR substrate-binding domain-containing protein [Hyphomicrobiales bacterium]
MSGDTNVSSPIVGRLDIQLLRSLIAVAEAPTISAAAKNLNLTQPTLSLQLKRLEERSGRALFEPSRQGRSRRLTAHGLRLVGYAKRIISAYDEAVLYLTYPELKGEIRLGVPEWFAEAGLNTILAQFKEMYANVQLRIVALPSTQLRRSVVENQLDVAIAVVGDGLKPIGNIWKEPLHWVASHDMKCLEQKVLPLGLFLNPCPFRDIITTHLASEGMSWREEYVSESVATISTAVAAGLAIAALPKVAVSSELKVIDDIDGFSCLPPVELGIFRSEGSHDHPGLNDLIQNLKEFIDAKMNAYSTHSSHA